MFCDNSALWIVIQCGMAGIAWGETGVAKSAFLEALANALKLKFYCFIPSQHDPADIGGIPHVDAKKYIAKMVHLEWLHRLIEEGWMILFDELTTAPTMMRPPLLSILNEGRVGDLRFHPSLMRCAAANPPEIAPNGSALEPSMLNRLYHHNWEFPFESWFNGMMNGGKFEIPTNFPLVGDYSTHVPKWTRRVGYLCQRHPAIRVTRTIPEGALAFPSPRQWHRLSLCLAGADKVGAGGDILNEIATGMVGDAAAGMLMQSIAASDLYDPNEIVDRTKKIDYANDRVDQLIYLPCGIMEVLDNDARTGKPTAKRMDNAVEVLIEMGEHGLLDCVGPVLSHITNKFDSYRVPKTLLSRYGSLVSQIGGAN